MSKQAINNKLKSQLWLMGWLIVIAIQQSGEEEIDNPINELLREGR